VRGKKYYDKRIDMNEQQIIDNRATLLQDFKQALMEGNIPEISRCMAEAEIITCYLSDNVNAIKIKMEELQKEKSELQIELIKHNSELQNWKSMKSSAKSVGANTRSTFYGG